MIVVEAVLPHQFRPISVEALRRIRIAFICLLICLNRSEREAGHHGDHREEKTTMVWPR